MFASTVSRWTPLHFAVAVGLFVLAQIVMAAGLTFPAASLFAPLTLVAVHLLTIGWLTVLMLGALAQFVPVITAEGAPPGISALVSLAAVVLGLAGMEAGFLALNGSLPSFLLHCLPAGGMLVLAGVATTALWLARILWRTRPLPFHARFVAAALVFLLMTLVLGIVMALGFTAPELLSWPGAFTDGLRLHLFAGLFGWFMLMTIGVSYKLVGMFTLAPEERGIIGHAVLGLTAGGLAAAWLAAFAAALGAPVPEALVTAAAALPGLGVALYLFDMARLYRARRRNNLELNTLMAIPALAALAVSLLFAAYLFTAGFDERLAGALGYLFLFGWLSGLGLSQLYKIVPFLTWLERYGSLLGKRPVPRVQDLVDEARDRPWFILYFSAVAAGTVFAALGWVVPWRVAVFGHLVATLMIARALWLARYGRPRPAAAAPPLSPFAPHTTIAK
jgi:hypothetical protein